VRPWPEPNWRSFSAHGAVNERQLRGRLAVAGLAALLLAGCVKQDSPGVAIQKLAADIVFGVKPPVDTPPPNLEPGQAGQGDATTYVPDLSSPSDEAPALEDGSFSGPSRPKRGVPRLTPLAPPRAACPPAALTAFPAKEAGQTVDGLPTEGQYRWKRSGTQTVATLPGVKLPIGGFEQRLIRNVKKITDTEYTFETVQPELGTEITTISTFKVKTGAVSRTVTPPVQPPDMTKPTSPVPLPFTPPGPQPTLPKPSVPGSVSVGDPERGISLMKLQRVDKAGNTSELTFSPAVLYLPLDIVPGEEWNAVGIDTRTGSVLQHQARVVKRDRVDACGDVVDGWVVESTQTFSGAAQAAAPRTYRYIVAPQLGGFIISEELHVTSAAGTSDIVLSLAQLNPTPLPPAAPAAPGQAK
jgi:hypothetical protein